MKLTPKQRLPAVELDPRRLLALDPRDDAERWLRALVELRLPSAAAGAEGSPQALMAALYAGVHELDRIESTLRQTRAPIQLTFVAPPWTWPLPVALWALALGLALTRQHEDDRLMTFAATWGVATIGALGVVAWVVKSNLRARREQAAERAEAAARRAEIVGDLCATRDTLANTAFALRLPREVLYCIPRSSTQIGREEAEAIGRGLEVGAWAALPSSGR